MPDKEQKVQIIHKTLIILIIILAAGLFLEFKYQKGERALEGISVVPQEQRHFIVPDIKEEAGLFEPEIGLSETKSEYIVKCDLPDVNKDQIEVSVNGNYLTISGRRGIKKEKAKEGVYYYQERRTGYFQRTILLPGLVDEKAVKAEYKDGILIVRLPKRKSIKQKRPEKIQII